MLDEKSAPASKNILTITRPVPTRQPSNQSMGILSTIEDVESTHSLTPTHTRHNEKSLDRETSPFSPFYNPTPTRYSLEAQKSESKQNINVIQSSPYDTDLEACLSPQLTTKSGNMGLLKTRTGNVECAVWPGQKALKQKKKAERRERGTFMMCGGCMAGLSNRARLFVKVAVVLLVIGTAIGVGLGVSKAVGGGIWKSSTNANSPISSR